MSHLRVWSFDIEIMPVAQAYSLLRSHVSTSYADSKDVLEVARIRFCITRGRCEVDAGILSEHGSHNSMTLFADVVFPLLLVLLFVGYYSD